MIKKHGLKHEICITLMALPPGCTGAHDPEFYLQMLDQILAADVDFDSLCFKDASGTATPSTIHETIKRARKKLGRDANIWLHTHETAGASVLCYQAALEAGADGIDLAMAPVSGGTSQPDILTMWHALRGTNYDLGIDVDKVVEAEKVFMECMEKYELLPEGRAVEPLIPWSPMPGGALTTNTQMLRDLNMLNQYPKIFAKMGDCVRRGGFGTSVTPVSQFYFQQAFLNFQFGDWKKIADGYGRMVLGYFGKTPIEPDPEIVQIASKQLKLEPTTEDPRAMDDRDPNKGVEASRKMLTKAGIDDLSEEKIFIAATCKEKGIQFLKGEGKLSVPYKVSPDSIKATGNPVPQPQKSETHVKVSTAKSAGAAAGVSSPGASTKIEPITAASGGASQIVKSQNGSPAPHAYQFVAAAALHHQRRTRRGSKVNLFQTAGSRWRW
jgi:pyruvate carboxylase subunit B